MTEKCPINDGKCPANCDQSEIEGAGSVCFFLRENSEYRQNNANDAIMKTQTKCR